MSDDEWSDVYGDVTEEINGDVRTGEFGSSSKQAPIGDSKSGKISQLPGNEGGVSPNVGTSEELQRLKNELDDRGKQLEELRRMLDESSAQQRDSDRKSEELRKQMQELQSKLNSSVSTIGDLQRKNTLLQEENIRLVHEHNELTQTIEDSSRRWESESGGVKQKVENLKEQLKDVSRRLAKSDANVNTLQRENEVLRTEKTRLERELADATKPNGQQESLIQRLRELEDKLRNKEAEVQVQEDRNRELRDRNKKLESDLQRLKTGDKGLSGTSKTRRGNQHAKDESCISDLWNEGQGGAKSTTSKSTNRIPQKTDNIDALGDAFNEIS